MLSDHTVTVLRVAAITITVVCVIDLVAVLVLWVRTARADAAAEALWGGPICATTWPTAEPGDVHLCERDRGHDGAHLCACGVPTTEGAPR